MLLSCLTSTVHDVHSPQASEPGCVDYLRMIRSCHDRRNARWGTQRCNLVTDHRAGRLWRCRRAGASFSWAAGSVITYAMNFPYKAKIRAGTNRTRWDPGQAGRERGRIGRMTARQKSLTAATRRTVQALRRKEHLGPADELRIANVSFTASYLDNLDSHRPLKLPAWSGVTWRLARRCTARLTSRTPTKGCLRSFRHCRHRSLTPPEGLAMHGKTSPTACPIDRRGTGECSGCRRRPSGCC